MKKEEREEREREREKERVKEKEREREREKEIGTLRASIVRTERLLATPSLLASLPDGGEQLRVKVKAWEAQLTVMLSKPYASPTTTKETFKASYKAYKDLA